MASYDDAIPVKLKNALTGEPVGVTINVVSMDSERVIKAARSVEMRRIREMMESEGNKLSDERAAEYVDIAEREQLIAAIDSWDFAGNSFGELGNDPACTDENKRYLVTHPSAKWIRDQLTQKVSDVKAFFTK